ncbi:MAG: dockerin type I domain-containing protein [bacterium]
MSRKYKVAKLLIFLLASIFIIFPSIGNCQGSTVDISVTATVRSVSSEPPPPEGGGGGGEITIAAGDIIFKGKAYPRALLTLLKDGHVIATFFAEDTGLFEKKITGLAGGAYNFGIFAEDSENRKSVTMGFTTSVLAGMTTTVSGIYISPTIDISQTQVEKGNSIDVFGQVFPQSEVNVFVASDNETVKKVMAGSDGKWSCEVSTANLETGEHQTRAKALLIEGEQTLFSQTLSFLVLEKGAMVCQGADLNFDGEVNIIDFSILLYFWGQNSPENPCVDINFDGEVNIIDFSIMMYHWSG